MLYVAKYLNELYRLLYAILPVPAKSAQSTNVIYLPVSKEEDTAIPFREYPVASTSQRPSDGTVELALELMKNDDAMCCFLHDVRAAITHKNFHFYYDFSDLTAEQRMRFRATIKLLQDGYLKNCGYSGTKFFGEVANLHTVIDFLNGRYLEIAIAELTEKTLATLAAENNFQYSLIRNGTIRQKNGRHNEFDLILDLNGTIRIVVEIKSGDVFSDYEKYVTVGNTYNIIPDNFILVQSRLSEKSAQRIGDVCGYRVCDPAHYTAIVQDMVLAQLSAPCTATTDELVG
mgnify:FL=1